jgi:hypothetical protein
MQHHLSEHYETAWDVADLVATHGARDVRVAGDGVRFVAELCGLRVYFENDMPVRFYGVDLDLTLDRIATAQPFTATLRGQSFLAVHGLANAHYTLCFRRGDMRVLKLWAERVEAFVKATGYDSPFQKAA